MGYSFRGQQHEPPEYLRAWADQGIWALLQLVRRLDVSGFWEEYRSEGWGGKPYDPVLMVATIWWCYQRGRRSPVDIARDCGESMTLRAMWARDTTPHATTFQRFISGHCEGWKRLQVSLIRCCAQADLLDLTVTATDSSPLAAPASMDVVESGPRLGLRVSQAMEELDLVREQAAVAAGGGEVELSCHELRRREARLLNRIAKLKRAEELARARDRQFHDDHPPPKDIWLRRIESHERGLAKMVAEQQLACDVYAAKVAAGCKPRGAAPRAPMEHPHVRQKLKALENCRQKAESIPAGQLAKHKCARFSPTDPDSRIVKGKNNTKWVFGRLFTITVGLGQIIVAGVLSPNATDAAGLHPNLAAAARVRDLAGITQLTRYDLADAGFASAETFRTPSAMGGQLLVAVVNETATIEGQKPDTIVIERQQMAERLTCEPGRSVYRLRSSMVEPVFAHILRVDRKLHLRGAGQHNEVIAILTAYNAGKYLRYRYSRKRPKDLTRSIP